MRHHRPRRLVELAAVLLAVAGAASVAAPSALTQGASAIAPAVSVQGTQLLRNGFPWVPRGVQIVGLVAPDGALTGKYIQANEHFSAAELDTAQSRGADTVRIQVSEFGLDPDSTLYSAAYVQEVQAGVQTARGLGLAVIVSLQAEPPAGEPTRCPLPDAGAERAWTELAGMFADDSGVLFELYNEPSIAATAAGWMTWLDGGQVTTANGSCAAVGMQTLIDDIRAQGADNVIIVPGLAGEQTLAGMPRPADPADPQDPQLAYGVHYPSLSKESPSWDREFGDASATAPVLVTEWDADSGGNCVTSTPARAQLLLDYLASKQIGIVGFALDIPGTIIANWSYTPTSYSDFTCGVSGAGPGQLLFGAFAAEKQAGDGSQLDPSPAWIVSSAALKRLATAAASTTDHFFDTPRTFVTGASSSSLRRLSVPAAVPTESFANEAALATTVRDGALPAGTQALIYDDQDSSRTPPAEQRHPAEYYQRAAQVAHQYGLLLIAAPATDLVRALAPRSPSGQQYTEFLRLGIAAAAARYADAYEAQAQGTEQHPSEFASFVGAASAQAAAAHPGVELLAQLDANFQGVRQMLLDAVLKTRSMVSGYSLNDPAPAFLRELRNQDG